MPESESERKEPPKAGRETKVCVDMRDYNNFHELINLTIQMKELLECPNLLGKDWKYKKTKRLVKETNKWLAKNYHKDGINKVKEKHFFGE